MTTVKAKYGFVPTSVMHFGKTKNLTMGYLGAQELRKSKNNDASSSSMSEFNPDLCKFIIQYWSDEYDYIVDPFHGWGTRAVIAKQLRRNYTGFDISPNTNEDVQEMLTEHESQSQYFETEKIKTEMICGDGLKIEGIANGSADLVFSCPPYFNIKKYESVDGQLSNMDDYELFIDAMALGAKRHYEVCKPDKYCVMVCGDWRVDNELLMFSKDMIDIYLAAGFTMHDHIIHKLNSPSVVGCGNFEKKRFVTKSHEHILVFKKVPNKKIKNILNKRYEQPKNYAPGEQPPKDAVSTKQTKISEVQKEFPGINETTALNILKQRGETFN